jgi:hypothetical protein
MLRLILSPFWWMQRRSDVQIVWPTCRDFSQNISVARNAFFSYALTRACWIDHYGANRLSEEIEKLQ